MTNKRSATVSVAAADAGSETVAMDIPSGKTFTLTDVHASYDDDTATARTYVEILDGTGGTVVDSIPLLTGDETSHEGVNRSGMREDVTVLVEASADGPVTVTVGGEMAE